MKVYSIKAVIIAIFYMLTSIRAGEKKGMITKNSNFYKLYWVQGANPYYNSKNPIIVHENCTPNDILDTLTYSEVYKEWNVNVSHASNDSDYVPKDVYITLFSEKRIKINTNYNLTQNGKSNWVYGNDYDDNNNDIRIKILLQKANSKQEPITDNDKENLVNNNENVIIGKGEKGVVLFSDLKKSTKINAKNNKQNNIKSNNTTNQELPSMIAAVMAITSQPTGNNNTQDQSPQKKNDISETEESDTQTDDNDKFTNDISKEKEVNSDNSDVDSSNKLNNNKDNINEEDSDDDTIDNNNKNNKQSKTEKSNTNEELILPEYKEVSSDIEEEDDELLNNDDEGKNKKLTVGKVIAFLTVIALFGIGSFYIYKNGHKLTKPDVKKKKKKQQ